MACVRGRGWRVCVAWLLCAWLACAWVPCRGVCVHAGWRVCVGDVVCAWVARVRGGVYVCVVCACCVGGVCVDRNEGRIGFIARR